MSVMKPGRSPIKSPAAGLAALRAGVPETRKGPARTRINLKMVGEALAARGLDPTEAIVDILLPVDAEGNATPCKLPADVQARILADLLQYTQPKLKSVEIKGRIGAAVFNPTDEQARALAEEFLRAQGGAS